MKKVLIYTSIITLSILFTIMTCSNITNDIYFVIQSLLTLLGLCIASYTIICNPLSEVLEKRKDLKDKAQKLLKALEEDMKVIFYLSIIIIGISIIRETDVLFIKDPTNIDFGCFKIISFKMFLANSMITIMFIMGLAGFYDFICSTFKIINALLIKEK